MKGAQLVKKAQEARGAGVTIAGNQGVGKTSLSALFPKPIIVRIEDGVESIIDFPDILVTDPIEKAVEVKDWLHRLRREKHDRKTAVFDSITALDMMNEQEIVKKDNASSLNSVAGGYGAGFRMLAAEMREIRQLAARLQKERGMHVVFIAHTQIEIVQPEDVESYNVLDLRMNQKSRPPFSDDVDIVAFMRLKRDTEQIEKDRKVGVSGGRRELVCYAHPALTAKNRLGIEKSLACPPGTNPILEAFEKKRGKTKTRKPEKPIKEDPELQKGRDWL